MNTYIIIIGLLSQVCYAARQLVQWIMTEKLRRVVSPTGYWAFSLAGCCFMLWYGWLREDIVILVGQILSFYVYVLNLDYKGAWKRIPFVLRIIFYLIPVVAIIGIIVMAPTLVDRFVHNPEIPLWLMIYGTCAQIVFLSRYAYQVVVSVKHHESLLPPPFWIISIVGASLIFVYGLYRLDPILIMGQSIAITIFFRNLWFGLTHPDGCEKSCE
ncbi:MAG: lipid-A-disaccharide synthase N-terminal domain-containing protein [Muribaculaceae bacterium]|nr:lipid-A-disaccharide synthase N-terminal domain-containing protein [Muribaculaceae bacterium]